MSENDDNRGGTTDLSEMVQPYYKDGPIPDPNDSTVLRNMVIGLQLQSESNPQYFVPTQWRPACKCPHCTSYGE